MYEFKRQLTKSLKTLNNNKRCIKDSHTKLCVLLKNNHYRWKCLSALANVYLLFTNCFMSYLMIQIYVAIISL